jgi:hypothetical protein
VLLVRPLPAECFPDFFKAIRKDKPTTPKAETVFKGEKGFKGGLGHLSRLALIEMSTGVNGNVSAAPAFARLSMKGE